VKLIDKTNGYIFAGIDASAVEFSKIAMGAPDWDYYRYPFFCFACAILTDLSFTLQLISRVKITSFVPYLHDRVALSAYTVVELFLVLIRKVMMV
jgi:hypothetical protein